MKYSKTNNWYKRLLSFFTVIVFFIAICILSLQINHFLPDYISFILFFASPLLLILNIYIAYRITKVLNTTLTTWKIITLNILIISTLLTQLWMDQNFYPRGNESSLSLCGSSDEYDVYSPDKTKKAIVYLYSCGATTGYTTRITLANPSDKLTDTTKSSDIYAVDYAGIDKITWLNNHHMLIEHNQSRKIFYWDNEHDGIKIDFRPIN